MTPIWALGLMTGTVLDGHIDMALIKTDGETIVEFGPWALASYPGEVNEVIARAVEAARSWQFQGREPALFRLAEAMLTAAHIDAIAAFLAAHDFNPSDIGIIGFHGQTVLHRPAEPLEIGATRQLGDGAAMAQQLGIDVAFDFRSADMAAGGQGAPLAAIYHAALLRQARVAAPAAVVNLGGIGNLTWWGGEDQLIAFDTGPANAPINDWMAEQLGTPYDTNGDFARTGTIDEERVHALLKHPFFSKMPTKSLDRYDFLASMADGYSPQDGAALLTAFSAACVAEALRILPLRPEQLIICGGGRKNDFMMAEIARRTKTPIYPAESKGWRGDAVEAECFAYLAVRCLRGLPISFPATTGVSAPMTGGRLVRAPSKPATPSPAAKILNRPQEAERQEKMTEEVICTIKGRAGCITLNRPKALNAITHEMTRTMIAFLKSCRADPAVELIIIDAVGGRAFCAGGDIRALYELGLVGDYIAANLFWRDEYRLNVMLATYDKPIVTLVDGLAMGGGVGVSAHASHRVVTERATIAMPECSIGLIPDVGVSSLFAKAGALGRYLALTGRRMTPADALVAGFADRHVPSSDIASLKARLIEIGDPSLVDDLARDPGPSLLQSQADEIAEFFADGAPTDIAAALAACETPFCRYAREALGKAAPLSAFASLTVIDALGLELSAPLATAGTGFEVKTRGDQRDRASAQADENARGSPVRAAVEWEYRFSYRALEEGELMEGIRAAVVDKDRKPHWRHASFADVTRDDVAQMIGSLGADEWTPEEV